MRLGKRPEVFRPVEDHAAGPVDTGELLRGQPDHRVGLAVLQIDVVLRRPLLDEVVLEDERLILGVGDDDLDIGHVSQKEPGLDVLFTGKVAADPVSQAAGLSHVDRRAIRVFHDVDARAGRDTRGPAGRGKPSIDHPLIPIIILMYRIMVRKQSRSGTIFLCLLLLASPLFALEKSIELGKANLWGEMQAMEGVTAVPGRWGFQDLALTSAEYAPDASTELLLHFDAPGTADATGTYTLTGSPPLIANEAAALGSGGAAFTGDARVVGFTGPAGRACFLPALSGETSSIEFWLYPATLSNGESIISWTGFPGKARGRHAGSCRKACSALSVTGNSSGTSRISSLSRRASGCPVDPGGDTAAPAPRMAPPPAAFRCPRGSSRIQAGRSARSNPAYHGHGERVGFHRRSQGGTGARRAPVMLGAGFTGFLDELRVSRRVVDDPVTSRFLGKDGLGHFTDPRSRLFLHAHCPHRSGGLDALRHGRGVLLQGSGPLEREAVSWRATDWVPFTPGTDFKDTLKARYIQLRVELYPDGRRAVSPRLSDLTVVYEPNVPPAPPAGLVATPGKRESDPHVAHSE